jgi:hypothetical protein
MLISEPDPVLNAHPAIQTVVSEPDPVLDPVLANLTPFWV